MLIYTFHTLQKPVQASSQFLSVGVYGRVFVCFSRNNYFTVYDETFCICSINVCKERRLLGKETGAVQKLAFVCLWTCFIHFPRENGSTDYEKTCIAPITSYVFWKRNNGGCLKTVYLFYHQEFVFKNENGIIKIQRFFHA